MFIDLFQRVLCVSPHADDESLGCGGLLSLFSQRGKQTSCVLVTSADERFGFTPHESKTRNHDFEQALRTLGVKGVKRLQFQPSRLSSHNFDNLLKSIHEVINEIGPDLILVPWIGDVHTDHRLVSDAVIATCKWFRQSQPKCLLMYETPSESDQNPYRSFTPNVFFDISTVISRKLEAVACYTLEVGDHPFPRSATNIEAYARVRGAMAGMEYAEAYRLVKLYN